MLNPLKTEADWHELRRTAERLINQATAAAESQSILLRELVGLDECLRLKNGSKNCCKTDFSGAAEVVSGDADNSSGRTRTCDPGLMKLSGSQTGTPALATENTVSSTPAESNLTLTQQTLTDEIQTPTDKLLQLEPLPATIERVFPDVGPDGRRTACTLRRIGEHAEELITINSVRYQLKRAELISPTWRVCQYREITPEEESHLKENRVDSGHDGILA